MKYVKIKAKNYNEALMQLKMEHGDDAIPISHKYVKEGGLFNSKLLAKDVVELTAAIQERKQAAPKPQQERKTGVDFTVGDNDAARKYSPQASFRRSTGKRLLPSTPTSARRQGPMPG